VGRDRDPYREREREREREMSNGTIFEFGGFLGDGMIMDERHIMASMHVALLQCLIQE